MNRGFTLIEVLVALTVLSAGALTLLRYLDGLNHLRDMERSRTRMLVAAIKSVEFNVNNPPLCLDTVMVYRDTVRNAFTLNESLNVLPQAHIAWLTVVVRGPDAFSMELERLVRCR